MTVRHKMIEPANNVYAEPHHDPSVPTYLGTNRSLATECKGCQHITGELIEGLVCIYVMFPKQRKFPCFFRVHVQKGGFDGQNGRTVLNVLEREAKIKASLPDYIKDKDNFTKIPGNTFSGRAFQGVIRQISEEEAMETDTQVFFSIIKSGQIFFGISSSTPIDDAFPTYLDPTPFRKYIQYGTISEVPKDQINSELNSAKKIFFTILGRTSTNPSEAYAIGNVDNITEKITKEGMKGNKENV